MLEPYTPIPVILGLKWSTLGKGLFKVQHPQSAGGSICVAVLQILNPDIARRIGRHVRMVYHAVSDLVTILDCQCHRLISVQSLPGGANIDGHKTVTAARGVCGGRKCDVLVHNLAA